MDELLEDARAALPPELYRRAVALFTQLDALPRPTGFGLSDEEIEAADRERKRLRR